MPNKTEKTSACHDEITVTSVATNNTRVPYGACSSGTLFVRSLSGATSVTWWVASCPESTLTQAFTGGNVALTTNVSARRAYPFPAEISGAPFVVLQSNSGTATIVLTTKS